MTTPKGSRNVVSLTPKPGVQSKTSEESLKSIEQSESNWCQSGIRRRVWRVRVLEVAGGRKRDKGVIDKDIPRLFSCVGTKDGVYCAAPWATGLGNGLCRK